MGVNAPRRMERALDALQIEGDGVDEAAGPVRRFKGIVLEQSTSAIDWR